MAAPLTVIIPTLNDAAELPGCAESLLPGLAAGLIARLVVSDGGSTDSTTTIAEALGATLVTGPIGRADQLARGAAEAGTPWLLLLHADVQLSPDWPEAVDRHIARAPDKAGHFRLAFRATGPAPALRAAWGNLRSRALGLPHGRQGLLLHRDTLAAAGGIPDLPRREDAALARALRGRLVPLPATAHVSARRYLDEGWFRRD